MASWEHKKRVLGKAEDKGPPYPHLESRGPYMCMSSYQKLGVAPPASVKISAYKVTGVGKEPLPDNQD